MRFHQVNDLEIEFRDETLTLVDGVQLSSRIWNPKKGGPWPALLMRQPYGKTLASTITYAHPSWWASHGFLVVIQDVRGQGESTGNFLGFIQEASDTSETHRWVRSLPECDGRLGTYGFSYQGLTQLLGEPGSLPPDCLVPAMTGLAERDHWSCEGGAHWWHLGIAWGLQLAALQAKRKGKEEDWQEIRTNLENKNYLRNGLSLLEAYDPNGMASKWFHQPADKASNWITHRPLKTWLQKPMLLIGGWWDPHLRGIIDLYKQSLQAGGDPKILIGPATHLQWWPELQEIQLNFFNKHLKRQKNTKSLKEETCFLWNLTNQTWLKRTKAKTQSKSENNYWALCSDGLACINANSGLLKKDNAGNGFLVIVHDPWRPVPSTGGHLSPSPGPVERSAIDIRSDVATFTTLPFTYNETLEGIPHLKLNAHSDQESFDLCVALSLVKKNKPKEVHQLSTGFLRVSKEENLQKKPRRVILQPFLAEVKVGECLRLSIAGAAWPAIGVNTGNSKNAAGPPNCNCQVITIQLELENSKFKINPLF